MSAIIDYRGKSPDKKQHGIPLVTAKIVKDGRIENPDEFIAVEDYDEWMRRGIPEAGDVVMTTEAPLGEVAQLDGQKVALAQRLITLRGKLNLLDNTFLKFAMKSAFVQNQLKARATGTTVLGIRQSELRKILLPIPTIDEQRAIGAALGAFDDKIELNRRMNETLEAIARAIFKSWFIDALPKKYSGRLPHGWSVLNVGDVCTRIAMGPFGSDIKTENFVQTGVPVIRGGNLRAGFIDEEFVYIPENKADELRNANAYPDDIVITHRGTLGQVGIIPRNSRFPRYVVSQSQMVLSVNPALATPRFIFEFLRSPAGEHELLANTSQTGVPAIARPVSALRGMELRLPPLSLQKRFQEVAQALADQQTANDHQSHTLSMLRDTVLPKLISGEIRIDKTERMIEAHA